MDNKKLKDDDALPPDLISEILYRLPVKQLCRCRLVCKPWNQLISSKDFQVKHYQRLAQQRPLLLTACPDSIDEDTPPRKLDLTVRDGDDGTNIMDTFSVKFPTRPSSLLVGPVQHCRGLVCISYADCVFLMNPSTREVIALPQFPLLPHCTGFGYDEVKDEFKVVRFFTTDKTRCAVFCLGSECWRDVACPPLSYTNGNLRAPLVNGAVHVLSDPKKGYEGAAIYGFNIVNEDFAKITLPADYYVAMEEAAAISLNELRGCLCMTFSFESNMDVRMLKDYENGVWEKVYTIEAESTDFIWGEPLLATDDGTILLQMFDEERDFGELYRYDPNDGEYYEKVEDNCVATFYVESLFPLGGGPDLDESSDSDEDADEDDDELSNSDDDDDDEDDDELSDSDDDEN